MSDRFAIPVRPRVQHAPVSPAFGAPPRREPSGRTGAERHPSDSAGETGIYLRRSWALVERMRAVVAARRGDATGL